MFFPRKTLLLLSLISMPWFVHAAGDPVAGQQKSATCAACHNADGNSSNPMYPKLAGQYADYLTKALHAYRTGERKNLIMAGFAAGLSDQDIEDLAAYFAAQPGLSVVKKPANNK